MKKRMVEYPLMAILWLGLKLLVVKPCGAWCTIIEGAISKSWQGTWQADCMKSRASSQKSLPFLRPSHHHGISQTLLQISGGSSNTPSGRLDYEHGFHAGNFADVIKHVLLIMTLQFLLQKKQKPIAYVETHAGAGLYSLTRRGDNELEAEFERGIGRLLMQMTMTLSAHQLDRNDNSKLPEAVAIYLDILESYQTKKDREEKSCSTLIYPGSPLFAATILKQSTVATAKPHQIILYEKAKEQYEKLQTNLQDFVETIDCTIHCADSYKALANYAKNTPNKPARALIMVDPPYQFGSDTDQVVALCACLHRHWRSSRVLIWHPVRMDEGDRSSQERLYDMLRQKLPATIEMLAIEVYASSLQPLSENVKRKQDVGTGMIWIQPPFGIEKECQRVLPLLLKMLDPDLLKQEERERIRIKWI